MTTSNFLLKSVRPTDIKISKLKDLKFPVYVSPKLDGVRALVQNNVVYSRTLKPIPNKYLQGLFNTLDFADGELTVGDITDPLVCNTTTSVVTTEDLIRDDICLNIFDSLCPLCAKASYEKRIESLRHYEKMNVNIVEYKLVNTLEKLLEYEKIKLAQGYEGIIVRAINVPYMYGIKAYKSGVWRLKRFVDSEAIILDMERLFKNTNKSFTNELGYTTRSTVKENLIPTESLGALVVRDIHHGWEFKIGTGFKDDMRKHIWENRKQYIGKIVKYSYFPKGMLNVPRLPSFKSFRDIIDILPF